MFRYLALKELPTSSRLKGVASFHGKCDFAFTIATPDKRNVVMNYIISFYRLCKKRLRAISLKIHHSNLLKAINGGTGLKLGGKIVVIHGQNFNVGKNVYVGEDSYINCKGGVTIGDYCVLSRRVTIYSYDHNFKQASCLPFDNEIVRKPVRIGRYVWIGMNVTVAPGTQIGDGAVIGIGSVVSGNIPDNAIVVNGKMRIVGYRDANHTKALADENKFYCT